MEQRGLFQCCMLRQEASTALSKYHSRESDWRIPDNARPMRRKIRTFSTRNQRPIGKVFEMQKQWRSVEVARCINEWANGGWDANETTWKSPCATGGMNQWTNEWMNPLDNESVNQWRKEAMNQRINESMNRWISEFLNGWINEPMNQSMNEWLNEAMTQWTHECKSQWIKEPRNQWIKESMNKCTFPTSSSKSALILWFFFCHFKCKSSSRAVYSLMRQLSQIEARTRGNTNPTSATPGATLPEKTQAMSGNVVTRELTGFRTVTLPNCLMWLTWWCEC